MSYWPASVEPKLFTRWFFGWRRRKEASQLPLGITPQDVEALRTLRASPHWPHYVAVLERIAEQQAVELSSGVPHDRYLFASGALTALRRIYTLVDDLVASAENLKEISDARSRTDAAAHKRHANTFVNTPWFDGWKRGA